MSPKKERSLTLSGGQLIARGDVIQVMDGGIPVKCRVLSCLAAEAGACYASLEILEGEKEGQRVETVLRPGEGSEE